MEIIKKFKSLTKYWWALMIVGIAMVLVGVLVFRHPGESYMSMAIIFGIVMLVSGLMQLVMVFTENYMPGRGWIAVGGAIELILGIVLLLNPGITVAVLPYILAFWLLFRGFSIIGIASDMRTLGISGMGWTIATGILLVLCAFLILFNPLFGASTLVVLVGIAFMIAGISTIAFSIDIISVRKKVDRLMK